MTVTKYTARFTTAGRLTPIETWLKQNIKGKWSFKLESIADDMVKKTYILKFVEEADLNSFKMRFTPAKSVAPRRRVTLSADFSAKAKSALSRLGSHVRQVRVVLGCLITPAKQPAPSVNKPS